LSKPTSLQRKQPRADEPQCWRDEPLGAGEARRETDERKTEGVAPTVCFALFVLWTDQPQRCPQSVRFLRARLDCGIGGMTPHGWIRADVPFFQASGPPLPGVVTSGEGWPGLPGLSACALAGVRVHGGERAGGWGLVAGLELSRAHGRDDSPVSRRPQRGPRRDPPRVEHHSTEPPHCGPAMITPGCEWMRKANEATSPHTTWDQVLPTARRAHPARLTGAGRDRSPHFN
jgi:hypothetical protein